MPLPSATSPRKNTLRVEGPGRSFARSGQDRAPSGPPALSCYSTKPPTPGHSTSSSRAAYATRMICAERCGALRPVKAGVGRRTGRSAHSWRHAIRRRGKREQRATMAGGRVCTAPVWMGGRLVGTGSPGGWGIRRRVGAGSGTAARRRRRGRFDVPGVGGADRPGPCRSYSRRGGGADRGPARLAVASGASPAGKAVAGGRRQ